MRRCPGAGPAAAGRGRHGRGRPGVAPIAGCGRAAPALGPPAAPAGRRSGPAGTAPRGRARARRCRRLWLPVTGSVLAATVAAAAAAGLAARQPGHSAGRRPRPLAAAALARPFAAAASWQPPVPAPFAALVAWPANSSLSLRTTGASIVEDADRTNSPISWSLAITALLSTPNSFASSYTRTFATALPLLGPAPGPVAEPGQRVLRPASASAVHRRVLIARSSQFILLSSVLRPSTANRVPAARTRRSRYSATLPARQWRRQAQRPRERLAALGSLQACQAGMQIRAPARQPRGESGTISSPAATRRSKSVLAARALQPTQVRTGAARALSSLQGLGLSGAWRCIGPSHRLGRCRRPASVNGSLHRHIPLSGHGPARLDGLRPGHQARRSVRVRRRGHLRCRGYRGRPGLAPCPAGCRSASRSAGPQAGRSAPLCRWPARAGSPAR